MSNSVYAILAEDISDTEALASLVRRHFEDNGLSIKKKSYGGCAGLCAKGARDIRSWSRQGVSRFVICHDADSEDPAPVRAKLLEKVVRPSGAATECCIAIPVQELEAWLLADETAINQVIPSFGFRGHGNPEGIPSPKEWLVRQSRLSNGKPLYSPKTFNPAVANLARLAVVAKKCPSFRAFLDSLSNCRVDR